MPKRVGSIYFLSMGLVPFMVGLLAWMPLSGVLFILWWSINWFQLRLNFKP